jgi:hypothetical protein
MTAPALSGIARSSAGVRKPSLGDQQVPFRPDPKSRKPRLTQGRNRSVSWASSSGGCAGASQPIRQARRNSFTSARRVRSGPPSSSSSTSPRAEGQRVRFSIESAQEGYLYLVDRDECADGTFGDPYLIFPTLRIRAGNNRVSPGSPVEIPAWEDDPPYLTLRRSRPEHVGEAPTVLILPQPLTDLVIGEPRRKLTAECGFRGTAISVTDVDHDSEVVPISVPN